MYDVKSTAFWTIGAGQGELREAPLPSPIGDEVQVRTLYSAVSRGTESLVWRGLVPESEYERMRAPFQEGAFSGPVKYGYIAVGIVEAGPSSLIGRNVFCLHPHQDRFVVPASAVTPLPEGVPPSRAVLAANMETAVNGLWDAKPLLGEKITVIGAGVVGLLIAYLAAQIPGTQVEVIDPLPAKAAAAKALGVVCVPPEAASRDADLVLHASGNPAGLELALEISGFEARIVEMSWYGTMRASLSLGGAFHAKRLKLLSSQVGHLPAGQLPRWDYKKRMELALRLLCDPMLDVLISGEDIFEDLPDVMKRITQDQNTLCHRIRYHQN